MTQFHIAAILRDVYSWQSCQDHPVRIAFLRTVEQKVLTPAEVKAGWAWFLLGYAQGMAHV